jgi:xylulose-5-phosphate/fructose-6-phosphate phosphoketolase
MLHAFGAAYDNPDLVVACIVGDGEAETGPCATSWHSNKFLNAKRDGAVLPILHLNGYKIANPTVLARIPQNELEELFHGYGYKTHFLEGDDPNVMHPAMAEVLDKMLDEIAAIQKAAREDGNKERPRWPMLILKTPKGWTGPKEVDGKPVEGTWRAHQVPFAELHEKPDHLKILDEWMRGYKPEELFDKNGTLVAELADLPPKGRRRMGMNPHANGGLLMQPLRLPNFREFAIDVKHPGEPDTEATRILGKYLRDVMKCNLESKNFRVFGPDETASNRLEAIYDVSKKTWESETLPVDENLALNGRVMEVLSEHMCQGWLEGYLLTGRHGFFSCYEAFIHIIDSMFNQHAKWLKTTRNIPWRKPIASLNYLLTSHVWRQDHNGFSHQDPGFMDHVANKKADIVRIYLPPDTNCLLSVADHCLKSRNYVNLIVAGKQPAPNWLDIDAAVAHCIAGAGAWDWAGHEPENPEVVMACAGDVPTLEILAAVSLLREELPDLRIRVVNVVDLMTLQPQSEHPHGLAEEDFDALFTKDKPVIFAFHGYPTLIHRLTYRRRNHNNIHVRGFVEEGTTTTPFDMVVLNRMDRFRLALDAVSRVPRLKGFADKATQRFTEAMQRHKLYVSEHGEDMPEVAEWRWSPAAPKALRA